MKTRTSMAVAGLAVIATLGVWQVFTGNTFFRQKRNMERAREHIPVVRAALDSIPEFKHLDVGVYTGSGGSLAVAGDLPSNSDVERVRQIVEATKPPVQVSYRIYATNELREPRMEN